jgi:two-component system, NarL family, nitrate/nitrite response regulator NarL
MTAIRIALVDDHPIVLQGLRLLFERQPDFTVVASFTDTASALAGVRSNMPDVLVLDLRMRGESGLDLLRMMAAEQLTCRSVLLTANILDNELVDAMKLGVTGVVLKESPPDALLDCIRQVHKGYEWIDRDMASRALRSVLQRQEQNVRAAEALTPRELEIVRMAAEGLRNRGIAERLSISEGTVKVHLHNIYDKLGVEGRLEMVLYAQQKGLIDE